MTFRKYAKAPGEQTRYRVYSDDGQTIGYVYSVRKSTQRMHGRIRFPTGHETMWGYDRDGRGAVNSHREAIYTTRQRAAKRLESGPRC